VDLPSPTQSTAFRRVWRGVRRTLGVAPVGRKSPATTDVVRSMLATLPDGLVGSRDRALLLLAFASALRRSEIVSLDVEDVVFVVRGIEVRLRRSKTDQEGAGRVIGVPYGANADTCPVRSVQAWLSRSGVQDGPLFRAIDRHGRISDGRMDGGSVARIIKRMASEAGHDPKGFGAHSTRAGMITSATAGGATEEAIARITGHQSTQVLRSYVRRASLFDGNAAANLGL